MSAGLAEPAEVLDAATHTQIRGVRPLSPWTWHIGSGNVLSGSDPYPAGRLTRGSHGARSAKPAFLAG